MSTALKSWSGMRKYLEQEMLAESLKGRVRYSATTFVGMDGDCVFELYIDDMLIKRFSMETVASDLYNGGKPVDMERFWKGYWEEKNNTPIENRREFDDREFANALQVYRTVSISESLNNINPVVRMFAVLDRRVGKRTLEKMRHDISSQPEWLKAVYKVRLEAENISII